MNRIIKSLTLASAAVLLAACQNNAKAPTPPSETISSLNIQCETPTAASVGSSAATLALSKIGTYVSGADFGAGAAEIVSFDKCSDKLYVVNADSQTVDVLDLNDGTAAPTKTSTIDLSLAATDAGISIGAANSVSASNGIVAVAIEAATKQDNGLIALYRSDTLALLNTFSTGALPDMVKLSKDGRYILTANEGEPSADYSNDPEGSVTLVDLQNGFTDAKAVVSTISFSDFNQGQTRNAELPATLRLPGPPGTSVAQDLEPEYIALADGKAYVSLQENNAMAIIDITSKSVSSIVDLGEKSWASDQLDPSDDDSNVGNFQSFNQLVGLYMPDTIVSFEIGGNHYIVSANEGDGREYIYETTQQTCDAASHEWDGDDYAPGGADEDPAKYANKLDDCISWTDETRGKKLNVNAAHPLQADLADDAKLGRLKVIKQATEVAAADNVQAFGARSFSIWNATGGLVFDSGDDIAKKVHQLDATNFNSNSNSNTSADSRSDDKGVEPEAIEAAIIDNRAFIFVGLERQGGIMVFDATTPAAPVFQTFVAARDFNEDVCTDVKSSGKCDNDTYNPATGDLAPESITYFSRKNLHFIAVGNEVSGTTTLYRIDL